MRGRKKSEETREAILKCASAVFAERPYHEVLTDDLSARLGIGKGTLYRYFGSKEEIYFATIVAGLEGMHEAVSEVLERDVALDETIEALARTVIGYFWERRDFFVLLHRHEPKLDPGERAEWERRRQEYVDTVSRVISRGLEDDGRPGLDSRLAAEMLFGMIRSVCMYRQESDRIENLARQVASVFLHGIRSEAPPTMARRSAARG